MDDAVIAAREREREQAEEVADEVVRAPEIQGCSLALTASAASSSASSSFVTSVSAGSNHTVTVQSSRFTRMRCTPGAFSASATTRGAQAGQRRPGALSVATASPDASVITEPTAA